MNIIKNIFSKVFHSEEKTKDVALVLSGGGARGFAHLGAIESLEEHGYRITSIAGTSMGALVGGIYAAGKYSQMKEIILNLNRKRILQIIDITMARGYFSSGDKLEELLRELIGDVRIEELPIKYCCSASDMVTGTEMVFREGILLDAIRASVSIPCFFRPKQIGPHIYVDGSVHNTLPLDRAERHKGDMLVAVNVSAPDNKDYDAYLKKYGEPENENEKSIWHRIPFLKSDRSANYMNMALRVARLTIQNNTQMAMRLTPPDICVEVPMNLFSLIDFDKGKEIIQYGKEKMDYALDQLHHP